jgi:group I intron endonuclease
MQNIFNKYGEDCFTFSTIELCDVSSLIEKEQYYIDTLKPDINICKVAGATYGNKPWEGRRHSEDSKRKIRESNIKTKSLNKKLKKPTLSKEDRMKRLADYSRSDENRKRVSEMHKGNKYWLGKKHNKSTIDARMGALNPNSKSVFCKELGITFTTGIEASIFFNKSRALISKCIRKGTSIKHNDIICTLK